MHTAKSLLCFVFLDCCFGILPSPADTKAYDLLVIGSGSAGLTAAKYAARYGKSVAIIEKARYGGDCTWTGCVPSKALLASAEAAHTVRNAAKYGVSVSSPPTVDFKAVRQRLRATIAEIYEHDDSPSVLQALGVDTIYGTARFVDPSTLEIADARAGVDGDALPPRRLKAKRGIVVATGARPSSPGIDGIDGVPYITYEDVFDLEELPPRLTVVGGGPIGVELGQAFARLGSSVTLVASRLLPLMEPEVDPEIAAALAADGVTIVRGRAASVARDGASGHRLSCSDGSVVAGDVLLAATGRVPVVDGMGLAELGARLNKRGGFAVDAQLRTSVKGVYAAGDCTGDQQFTHYAGSQGGFAATNALIFPAFRGVAPLPSAVPGAVFTSPEVARMGMTEAEAREAHGEAQVGVAYRRMQNVDRAVAINADPDEVRGFIKIVYKTKSLAILGATVVGPSAGELTSELAVAMAGGVTLSKMTYVMHAYPTVSFAIYQIASDVYSTSLTRSLKPVFPLLDFINRWR